MSRLTLAALLCLFATGAMAEEYYKWKDENGVWNYTTTPPKDKASTTVNIATGAMAEPAPPEAGAAEAPAGAPKPPGVEKQPSEERSLADTADAVARIKQTQNANCERARANVATLEANSRVQIGERALTDEEQLQELVKARRQVEVFCNSR